jgi:phosphomannomutase
VGMALLLQYLLETGSRVRELRDQLPAYAMVKDKLELGPALAPAAALERAAGAFAGERLDETDGLKFLLEAGGGPAWVQLRASNTEPILRIFSEALSPVLARELVERVKTAVGAS